MQVRFWGVRGSVPWTIPAAIGHGCNTPCVEITDEHTAETVIFDAGSGIVGLGQKIGGTPRDLPIVLTHYHWDHIQGLPFLAQLYAPGWAPRIFAPAFDNHDTAWVNTIFQSPFFPVPYEHLPNPPDVELIDAGEMRLGPFDVSSIPLNHPGGALAYRIRGTTGDIVYATDHEFGDRDFDEPLAEFARGAAAIIMDAHFTPDRAPEIPGVGPQRLAAMRGVRRGERHRRPVALPSQAGPDRRRARADPRQRTARVPRHGDGVRGGGAAALRGR